MYIIIIILCTAPYIVTYNVQPAPARLANEPDSDPLQVRSEVVQARAKVAAIGNCYIILRHTYPMLYDCVPSDGWVEPAPCTSHSFCKIFFFFFQRTHTLSRKKLAPHTLWQSLKPNIITCCNLFV